MTHKLTPNALWVIFIINILNVPVENENPTACWFWVISKTSKTLSVEKLKKLYHAS